MRFEAIRKFGLRVTVALTLILQLLIVYKLSTSGPAAVASKEEVDPTLPRRVDGISLPLVGRPVEGSESANAVLVEFSDYECPYCRQFVEQTLDRIREEFIVTGQLKFVSYNFPLPSAHPSAVRYAKYALCAGEQRQYWQMHDRLFTLPSLVSAESAQDRLVAALALDARSFDDCFNAERTVVSLNADLEVGKASGVEATPTSFIGVLDPLDRQKMRARLMIEGAMPYSSFKTAIETVLGQSQASSN